MSEWLGRKDARYRTYFVERRYIVALLVRGAVVEAMPDGVPEDAQLVGMAWDEVGGGLHVSLYHSSFEDVSEENFMRTAIVVKPRVSRSEAANVRGITLRDVIEEPPPSSVAPVRLPPTARPPSPTPHATHMLASGFAWCARCRVGVEHELIAAECRGLPVVTTPTTSVQVTAWHASHALFRAEGRCVRCGTTSLDRLRAASRCEPVHASHPAFSADASLSTPPTLRCTHCGVREFDVEASAPCRDQRCVRDAGHEGACSVGPVVRATSPVAPQLCRRVVHQDGRTVDLGPVETTAQEWCSPTDPVPHRSHTWRMGGPGERPQCDACMLMVGESGYADECADMCTRGPLHPGPCNGLRAATCWLPAGVDLAATGGDQTAALVLAVDDGESEPRWAMLWRSIRRVMQRSEDAAIMAAGRRAHDDGDEDERGEG